MKKQPRIPTRTLLLLFSVIVAVIVVFLLFGERVNMALTTHNGWVFADTERHTWLQKSGFTHCTTQPVPPPMPHWRVTATKAQ